MSLPRLILSLRPSRCGWGCVAVTLLVLTLGAARFLAAAPALAPATVPLRPAVVSHATPPAGHDFARTLHQGAEAVRCSSSGCGFLRVSPVLHPTYAGDRILQRPAPPSSWAEAVGAPLSDAAERSWIAGSRCDLGCGEALRRPEALTVPF